MCSHYQTREDAELLLKKFGVTRPEASWRAETKPTVFAEAIYVRTAGNQT